MEREIGATLCSIGAAAYQMNDNKECRNIGSAPFSVAPFLGEDRKLDAFPQPGYRSFKTPRIPQPIQSMKHSLASIAIVARVSARIMAAATAERLECDIAVLIGIVDAVEQRLKQNTVGGTFTMVSSCVCSIHLVVVCVSRTHRSANTLK